MSSTLYKQNSVALERVHYFPRQLITATDMTVEAEYFRQKLRRHNRFLHGWGVVCGYEVTAAPTEELPLQVRIGSGYALSPQGDEIYVAESFCFDLAKCIPGPEPNPCEPGSQPVKSKTAIRQPGQVVYLAIKYVECPTRPVRVHPAGCGCDETSCEYSRIRDDFELACLTTKPDDSPLELLCDLLSQGALATCPPCPEEPWVVLSEVKLPPAGTALSESNIDNFVRRQLFSTDMLQAQLIACCCKPERPGPVAVPAQVTSIDPPDGEVFAPIDNPPSQITITFSKDIDPNSVTPNTLQVARDDTPLAGDIMQPGPRTVTFRPAGQWLPGTNETYEYSVLLLGDGANPIRDAVDALALDGDGDGQEGGNFTSTFTVVGPKLH